MQSEINPNGASELAALMRRFVADLREARAAIEHGRRSAALWARHRMMRCAWPTAPSDRDQTFDAQALVYLGQVRSLDENPKEAKAAYRAVLAGCRACHEARCPGPLEVIESLQL